MMELVKKIKSHLDDLLVTVPKHKDDAVGSVLSHLLESDPDLGFARATRPVEHAGFTRIVRAGILNPFKEGGNGVYFVKGCNDDPTGIFFTDAYRVNDAEYGDAIEAYLFAYGIPRDDLAMVPVTFWPKTYERTPENIAALRAVGAPLPNEGL